ncbi:MAG: DUF1553 domain-containing protein [Verrucomicrobiales bacterium]|nr:DUF1553 domain-containing protein [Verrucomicrobiales bacterium]
MIAIFLAATPIRAAEPHPVYETDHFPELPVPAVTPSDRIDEAVFTHLAELGIAKAHPCSDAVFLRRAYLAVIGTLPRDDEAIDFLASTDENKREGLVEHLLQRPEYGDFWAMKWGDLLRVKAEFPIKLWPNAVQAYHKWIHDSVRSNKLFHHFVQELLVSSGSNFREGQVNFYRAMPDRSPGGIASTVALTFMGERAEKWPPRKLEAMAGFFANVSYKATAEWKEEIVFFDPLGDKDLLHKRAIFPDGTPVTLDPGREDPRAVFAGWLLRPENPYFSRVITNRVWSWLMGRGIVHEPDDFRTDNPPSNPALLAVLESEFIASRCDVRHLFRAILNSRTFALSSIPEQDTPEAAAQFAHYPLRRLEAEVFIDAINQITGTAEEYSSPIPEPFTFIPEEVRAIALADGSITSSFLELFGRPPRDTGLEAERSRTNSAQQRLHLLNSSHIQKKIAASPLVADAAGGADLKATAEPVYLTLLSRYPTPEEIATLKAHVRNSQSSGKSLATDLVWALINQPEFYHNH